MTAVSVFNRLASLFPPRGGHPPAAGLYHFRYGENGNSSRIHLRIDPDGAGVLVVNAARLLHLNPSAAWMAYQHLHHIPVDETIRGFASLYQTQPGQLKADYDKIADQLDELIKPDGACPIHEMDLESTLPFSSNPSAPYRMDLAITYRCNNDCFHCYNDRPRNYPELNTNEWKNILDRCWDLAIPHVVFTGGEPTLRNDLPELIAYAEKKGMIAGLNTNGRRMADQNYLQKLVDAGLDHVQITLESHDPAIHDQLVNSPGAWKQTINGIQNAIASKLYIMTNTTMLRLNSSDMRHTLEFLVTLGVPTVGLNSLIYSGKGSDVGTGLHEDELPALLDIAKSITASAGQKLIWYTPTEYCQFDPVTHELGIKGCTAAFYNMCIEPDGAVLPCQSYYQSLGNMLDDTWDSIWNHPLSISLRERRNVPERCDGCSLLSECGGGCPLHRTIPADQAIIESVK